MRSQGDLEAPSFDSPSWVQGGLEASHFDASFWALGQLSTPGFVSSFRGHSKPATPVVGSSSWTPGELETSKFDPSVQFEAQAPAYQEVSVNFASGRWCNFGGTCKCAHVDDTYEWGGAAAESSAALCCDPAICRFGRECKRKCCWYQHPQGRFIDDNPTLGECKFGASCSRRGCFYKHTMQVEPVDSQLLMDEIEMPNEPEATDIQYGDKEAFTGDYDGYRQFYETGARAGAGDPGHTGCGGKFSADLGKLNVPHSSFAEFRADSLNFDWEGNTLEEDALVWWWDTTEEHDAVDWQWGAEGDAAVDWEWDAFEEAGEPCAACLTSTGSAATACVCGGTADEIFPRGSVESW